ncbi:MAG: protein kinase [candidate division Zixibacteria bacterium]|nr:protein kinase [candidate division Zixibacteria bacterium]
MIGKTISHYRILEKLGEGGMGVVYKAQNTKLERVVAIKFLPQHLTTDGVEKERFVHEAKAASALNHTNVTTIYEIDEFEGQTFIVMEYCEGETLRQIIQKETLSIRKVLDIAVQICEGLTIAHEKGIVHRDIKSDNIMLTPRGQVKIMDFGLAKLKGATKLTQSRTTLGTASYMSPEQAQREEVDRRSDIFSFGVVLYELLTGQLPFQGEHEAAVLHAIISEEPLPVARFNNKVSTDLERIVSKAMAKEKEERYQHIDDVLADLRREKKSLEYVKTTQIPPEAIPAKPRKTLLPFIVPASIIFVLVLLFLILKPFQLQIAPEKKAVAEENTLAIMYFENLKDREDKERIGEMVSELLITGLSESQYMRVVSSQRLYDLLKMMGREGTRVIDKTVASEVAQKAEAKYMILGKILSTHPDFIITSQLVDVQTGNVVASQRVARPEGTDMFSLVDSLSSEIRKDLEIPALAQREEEKPVADITTHSPEALRLYLEGNELFYKLYMKEAAEKFKAALKIDTTFASAYLKLAFCYSNLKDVVRARTSAEKAARFSNKVSKKERFLIDAVHQMFQMRFQEAKQILEEMVELYPDEKIAHENLALANRIMGDYEEAIAGYNKVIELDSLDKETYNSLAYAYDDAGRHDEAIQSINKYIQLAPGEANPYDSRGDIYARHAEVDKAIESYKKALEIKPDFEASIEKLGLMHLHKREYDKAERYFLQYGELGEKTAKSISRADLALIPLAQGKYEQAVKVLNQGIAADELDKLHLQQVEKYEQVAQIHVEKKEFGRALQYGQRMVKLVAQVYPALLPITKPLYGYFLVKAGELDSAQKISNEVREQVRDRAESEKSPWYFLRFMIKYASGDMDQALKEIGELAEREKNDLRIRYWLAVTYLESDMIGEAVQEFERLSNWNILSRARNPLLSSKIPYFLGICYEKSGWERRAIEKYEEFLEIWKDADPGIPEVEDARQKLAQLKKKA